MDDFKDHPASVSEIKGDKEQNAARWKPRDALIAVLRDLDSGKINPDALVISFREQTEDGFTSTRFATASPDIHTALGLLEMAKAQMLDMRGR